MNILFTSITFRTVWPVFGCSLLILCLTGAALGLSEYVIGGEQHPWTEMANPDPEETKLIDYEQNLGSIEPLYTDSTFNLAQQLLDDDRPKGLLKGGVYKGRGGWAVWGRQKMAPMFDGDAESAQGIYVWHMVGERRDRPYFLMDLIDQFRVSAIRFYPRILQKGDPEQFPEGFIFSDNFLTQYRLAINNGTKAALDWLDRPIETVLKDETENFDPFVEIKLDPPQMVRYVMLYPGAQQDWEIAEWEVLGGGYVPSAIYTTQVVDLGDIASWGDIRWEGVNVQDPDARLFIQTRTGTDPSPVVYWMKTGQGEEEVPFDENGRPLTKRDWKDLPLAQKGRRTYDTEHWSFWSPPYSFEEGLKGTPIVSPGPRRYIQIRIQFTPTLNDAGRIDQIAFEYSQPPCAHNVVAEIWPDEAVPAEVTDFTYALKGDVQDQDTGFDRLHIHTSTQAQVKAVRIAGQDVELSVDSQDKDGFTIGFPKIRDDRLLEVDFSAPVLMYGTRFDGWVSDSAGQEAAQRVNAGDAKPDWGSDGLAVKIALGAELIAASEVSSTVITPNGDGVNDVVQIQYKLLKLTSATPVKVGVYDLFGELVKEIYVGDEPNGEYIQTWDGTDQNGDIVPPGLYLYLISVGADQEAQMKAGTLAVVY